MAVDILLSDIGAGEAEAIVLALECQPAMILLDDLKARKFAKMQGLNIIGTMGILLEAKKAGFITAIKPFIAELISNDIRISTKIVEITLQAAQE
jgi:predicted nucleic acid-binding protein